MSTNPRERENFTGHKRSEAMLLKLAGEGRMPHAMLFSGPKGIGKATLAFRLARYLLANENERQDDDLYISPQSSVFHKIAALGHPDFLLVQRSEDKNSILVDDTRQVESFLRLTSSGGGWKIAIVDDADTMNRNAQNALLKILEEPPAKSLLLLVAHRPGFIIPTIRSRCRAVTFRSLENDQLKEVLEMCQDFSDLGTAQKQKLVEIADGSPGRALGYLENGSLEIFEMATDVISSYPKINWPAAHQLADLLSGKVADKLYKDFQTLLMSGIHSAAKGKVSSENRGLKAIAEKSSLPEILKIEENLAEHLKQGGRANLDKKQVVLGAFACLEDK